MDRASQQHKSFLQDYYLKENHTLFEQNVKLTKDISILKSTNFSLSQQLNSDKIKIMGLEFRLEQKENKVKYLEK